MAFIRPTQAEREKRIKATADLLASGVRKEDIKRCIAHRFSVSPRSVERYLRQAQAVLIGELSEGPQELHKARSLQTYRAILQDTDDEKTAILCQTRIDKILGLEHQFTPATVKHEHQHAVSVKLMEQVRKEPKLRNSLMEVLDALPGGFDE